MVQVRGGGSRGGVGGAHGAGERCGSAVRWVCGERGMPNLYTDTSHLYSDTPRLYPDTSHLYPDTPLLLMPITNPRAQLSGTLLTPAPCAH